MARAAKRASGKSGGGKSGGAKSGGAKGARVSAKEMAARAALENTGGEDPNEIARVEAALTAPLPEPEELPIDEENAVLVGPTEVDVAAPPDIPDAPEASSLPPPPPVAPAPPVLRHQLSVVYRPDAKRHMSKMGLVSTQNWIGRCKGHRVSVRYGAPLSTIPHCVREMLADAGIRFGYAPPPPGQGAETVREPPRARRADRNPDKGGDKQRPFRSVRGLQSALRSRP